MRMKKTICILFAALFITSASFAASLESVCAGLAKHPHTTGDFTQVKTMKATGRSLKSSGNFIFSLEGIMWKTVKPFPSTLAVSETQIIQTAADGSRTVIEAAGNEIFASIANTLKAVFTNDLTLLQENFNTFFSEEAAGKWTINLDPKDSTIKSVMKSLTLKGTVSDITSLDSITMTEASENTITYSFINQKYPKELSDGEKAFFLAE